MSNNNGLPSARPGFSPGGAVKSPSGARNSKPSGGGPNFTTGNTHKSGHAFPNKPGKGC